MSLKNYSHEEIKQMPKLDLANLVLSDKKKAIPFKELYDEISTLKEFSDEQKKEHIGQFYTDLNMEGRFVNAGSNTWALKRWYPVDEVMKESKPEAPKKKKKKSTKKKQQPEPEESETTSETTESDATDNDMEELTGDFSQLEGKDDVEEEEQDIDLFAQELDIDENFDDEGLGDDEFDEDEDEADEEDETKEESSG